MWASHNSHANVAVARVSYYRRVSVGRAIAIVAIDSYKISMQTAKL